MAEGYFSYKMECLNHFLPSKSHFSCLYGLLDHLQVMKCIDLLDVCLIDHKSQL